MTVATYSRQFWLDAVALSGSVTPRVGGNVLLFGLFASGICFVDEVGEHWTGCRLSLPVAPFELAGAVLGLLLVLRTNAGYDRWWEARKLWGGIVNQSRNLAISAAAYGPDDERWRDQMLRWTVAFCHVAKSSLRGEPTSPDLERIVGRAGLDQISAAPHRPSFVAGQLARGLQSARHEDRLDGYAFLQIDRERALLIDHIGACERILKTPLPRVYAIKIRRFLALFLLTLPLALLHKLDSVFLIPPIVMLVAYPLLALDQIGVELQNPFAAANLSSLTLDDICRTIEGNLLDAKSTSIIAG